MIQTLNTDLIVLGSAISAIGILGFVVFFQNTKSVTNRTFLLFSLVSIIWGTLNYASYHAVTQEASLWLWRFVIFSAVWFCFGIFHLAHVYPAEERSLSTFYRFAFIPLVALCSLLTLTPFVFAQLSSAPVQGQVPVIQPGPLIPFFGLSVVILVAGAVYEFLSKIKRGAIERNHQTVLIMTGTAITFALLILCNFILPIVFKVYVFIPFGAVFIFPFIACTAYAIIRYHLFNVRVIATEIFAFILTIATLLQVVFSSSAPELLFRIAIFILVLAFVILLIRSVLNEVQQREKIEKLAGELESANERLKQLDQLKSEFLSVASHQLRAPITAIKGYVANILEGLYGDVPEHLKDPLGVVQESARVMTSSIEDYLDVSRIEQGRMKYEMSVLDISPLAEHATQELKPVADKKGLTLTFAESPSSMVNADFGKIKQVFTNLIDNAIKYTEKGNVTVLVTHARNDAGAEVARFMTQDTGIGIAADEIGGLFEKFTRARDANKVNTTGTGLGLYVAKELVEGMGGKIWAESEGQGKGSRFIVEMPLASENASATS